MNLNKKHVSIVFKHIFDEGFWSQFQPSYHFTYKCFSVHNTPFSRHFVPWQDADDKILMDFFKRIWILIFMKH